MLKEVLRLDSQRLSQVVGRAALLTGGSGGDLPGEFLQIVGRIQFLQLWLWDSHLLASCHSGASPSSLRSPVYSVTLPLHLQTSKSESSPSHALNLSAFPFCQISSASHFPASLWLQLEKVFYFWGFVWFDWTYLYNPGYSPHLKVHNLNYK